MKLLLTRPLHDSKKLESKLKDYNFSLYLAPLININFLEIKNKDYLTKYDLIIFTSRNSLQSINQNKINYKDVITIGPGTYEKTIKFGYKNVIRSNGGSIDLVRSFSKIFKHKKLKVFHPTSNFSSDTLENFFKKQGSSYKKVISYKVEKKNLNPKIFEEFIKQRGGIVSIFSSKTAESFFEIVEKKNYKEDCKNKFLILLSKSIKPHLGDLIFKKIIIADQPNELCFIKVLLNFQKKVKEPKI